MEVTIGAFDARRQFGKLLNDVAGKQDQYIVERHGEPVAAVVPIELYEQWKRRRTEFFDRLQQTAQRSNLSEAEGMSLALEAVQAVRAEGRTERAQPGE